MLSSITKPPLEPATGPANSKDDEFNKWLVRMPSVNKVMLSSKNLRKLDLEQSKMDQRKREMKKMSKRNQNLYKNTIASWKVVENLVFD